MKKFTMMLIATMMVVFAQAADPVKPIKRIVPVGSLPTQVTATPVPLNAKQAPANLVKQVQSTTKARAPKKAAASAADLAGSYRWDYYTASERAVDPTTVTGTAGSAYVTLSASGDNVTISGMFPNDITGTYSAADGYITITGGSQVAGTSSYGDYKLQGLFYYEGDATNSAGWYYTDIYIDVNADGSLTVEDWLVRVLSGGTYDGYSLTPYYMPGSTLTPDAGPEVVTPPANLVAEEYSIVARNYNNDADVTGSVFVGIEGNDIYIKGLSTLLPEAWVKGTLNGSTVTFAKGQYFGIYANTYSLYLNSLMGADVVFDYDAANNKFTAQNAVFLVDNGTSSYFDSYRNAVITKVVEVAAMPANPSITEIYSGNYGDEVVFDVPTIDTEGNGLVTSKLSFQFYTDIEHTVSPLTFEAGDAYPYLEESISVIPYGFKDNGGQGWDFFDGEIFLNMDHSTWNKIGIKSIYTGGGETNETEIQWFTIKEYKKELTLTWTPAEVSVENGQEIAEQPVLSATVQGAAAAEPVDISTLNVTYTTSNEEVATWTDNGLTIVGVGEAVITAAVEENDEYTAATAELTVTVTEPEAPAAELTAVSDKFWKWDAENWPAGEYTATTIADNIEVAASSSKKVTIEAKDNTIGEETFAARLKFGGTGNANERNIHFKVAPNTKITVYGETASSSTERTCNIATGTFDNIVETFVTDAKSSKEYEYTGTEETDVYLYSANSGFNIFGIKVEAIGEEPEPEPEPTADGDIISWTADDIASAGGTASSYSVGDFVLNVVDTDGKIAVDANTAYFGDATAQKKFTHRLKTGGKSSSKNSLTLTVPSEGKVKVYVRTGSNSATDRNLVLTQNGTELYNQVIQESNAVEVAESDLNVTNEEPAAEAKALAEGDPATVKVYPAVEIDAVAGTVEIGYPTGSLNFYGFEFVSDEATGIEVVETLKVNSLFDETVPAYNLAGQRVSKSYRGVVIQNGKKFFNK